MFSIKYQMAVSKAAHGFGWMTPLSFFQKVHQNIYFVLRACVHTYRFHVHTQVACCCIRRATEQYKTVAFIPLPQQPSFPTVSYYILLSSCFEKPGAKLLPSGKFAMQIHIISPLNSSFNHPATHKKNQEIDI